MVGGTPKPFACTKEGCSMTFTTEDHLNVHQKKHQMDLDLSLGNKTIFVADQTPTPTRFLRNCEEVGLFQDLQNVNPFEETFRRAVESGKTGSLHEPDNSVDDTLHTPHVFPLLSEDSIYTTKKCNNNTEPPTIKITEDIPIEKPLDINNITNEKDKNKTSSQKEHDYALDMSNDKIMLECTNKNDKTVKNKAKVRLKQAIKNKKNKLKIVSSPQKQQPPDTIFLPQTAGNLTTFLIPTNTGLIPLNSLNVITSIIPEKKNNTGSNLNDKKQKLREKSCKTELLERNRAAASRCRKKKKQFMNDLQRDYEKIYTQNNELLEEIANLKYENAQLKSLLLAHKDCPVTKAMGQAKSNLEPHGLIKVNFEMKKNRLVLPKIEPAPVPYKVPKISTPPQHIAAENIAILTAVSDKKSVIVLSRTPSL